MRRWSAGCCVSGDCFLPPWGPEFSTSTDCYRRRALRATPVDSLFFRSPPSSRTVLRAAAEWWVGGGAPGPGPGVLDNHDQQPEEPRNKARAITRAGRQRRRGRKYTIYICVTVLGYSRQLIARGVNDFRLLKKRKSRRRFIGNTKALCRELRIVYRLSCSIQILN